MNTTTTTTTTQNKSKIKSICNVRTQISNILATKGLIKLIVSNLFIKSNKLSKYI